MKKSRLFLRIFSTIVVSVAAFSSAIYLFSAPLIEEKGYEIELNASRTILDNVFVMASKINRGLEDQRSITVDLYKRRLTDAVELAASYADHVFARMERGEIDEAEARRQLYDGLGALRFGAGGYIWVTDYRSVLLSHPDPDFQGRDAAQLRDPSGEAILPAIIAIARTRGEGYHTYHWQRPGESRPSEKIAYFRDLPRWHLVIGTGAYFDDIETEVERRKAEAIDDLRQALRAISIARTGYVYIFDAANNMIIHPNANIEGTEFGTLTDPATGRPINEELKAVADSGRPLTYRWDKPDDPGNYAYDKISYVRHFKDFDWYIASSVYVDELRRSSAILANRLLVIALTVMVLASTLGYFAVRRLVRPLNRLAETAAEASAGRLDVTSGIRRDDEIGVLAQAFDGLIRRVKDDIATLDSRVRERTAELEEAEARQRLIIDAIPAAIAYLGRDEVVAFANRGWADLVRRDKAQVIGRDLVEVIGRRAHARISPYIEITRTGAEASFEYAFANAAGQTVVTKNVLIPHLSPTGEVSGLFVLSLDITDEKETERHLMEAQRMKAVGQLSGGLAHDFNNLLSIILGNLAVAREKYAATPGLDAYLEPAQRASRRGADITSRLLAFSRQQPLKPVPVEVCALLRETSTLLRRSLPETIALSVPDDRDSFWAIADPNQLENALVNLAFNARDAMPGGGRIDIAVTLRKIGETEGFDEPVTPDDYLEIQVADSGSGFAPDALIRAFEPFFTTKALGSGLGLSMVYGFVKQSRGFIRIDSQPGRGSTVTILLPRAEPAPRPIESVPATVTGEPWRGRLALVAEDDGDVRRVLRGQLIDLGFSVVEAASGDEAADLAADLDDLALVVSDISMPGLSGIELARQIGAGRPGLRIVLVSGFAFNPGADAADLVILRKPWERQDLVAAIGLPPGAAADS